MTEDLNLWREFTQYEERAVELWYEFLKLSDPILWSGDVAHNFGDLSGSFEEWWPSHKHLFRELKKHSIDEVLTESDFEFFSSFRPSPKDPGCMVFGIWMDRTKGELRLAFEDLLTKYHKGNLGRQKFHSVGDYYSFEFRPDNVMLNKILAVYKIYSTDQKTPKKDRMPLWKIEEVVSKSTPLILKAGDKAEYLWTRTDKSSKELEVLRKKSQHNTVRKYINYAEEILKNVVIGKFPVYNVSKSKKS